MKQIAIPEMYLSFYVSSFIMDNRVKQLLAFFFFFFGKKKRPDTQTLNRPVFNPLVLLFVYPGKQR